MQTEVRPFRYFSKQRFLKTRNTFFIILFFLYNPQLYLIKIA